MKKTKVQSKKESAAKQWAKDSLPLLRALKSFKNGKERTTLLGYLNDEACESIYHMIANVLRNDGLSKRKQNRLATALEPHKKNLRKLTRAGGRAMNLNSRKELAKFKRKTLVKMGGGVLSTLLSIGLPLLLSLVTKKK